MQPLNKSVEVFMPAEFISSVHLYKYLVEGYFTEFQYMLFMSN